MQQTVYLVSEFIYEYDMGYAPLCLSCPSDHVAIVVFSLLVYGVVPGSCQIGIGLIEEVQGLCQHAQHPHELFEASSAFVSVAASTTVTLVSYSTPGIYEYAGYSLTINAFMRESMGME